MFCFVCNVDNAETCIVVKRVCLYIADTICHYCPFAPKFLKKMLALKTSKNLEYHNRKCRKTLYCNVNINCENQESKNLRNKNYSFKSCYISQKHTYITPTNMNFMIQILSCGWSFLTIKYFCIHNFFQFSQNDFLFIC